MVSGHVAMVSFTEHAGRVDMETVEREFPDLLGGGQSRGFLIHPADLPGAGKIVGAEALHKVVRGWLTHLGHPPGTETHRPPTGDRAATSGSCGRRGVGRGT